MNEPVDIKDKTPNESTIKILEGMLEDAKSGDLRSVVAICGWNDDSWTHNWSIDGRNTRRRMLGEMSMLQFDMLTNQSFSDGDTILAKAFYDE